MGQNSQPICGLLEVGKQLGFPNSVLSRPSLFHQQQGAATAAASRVRQPLPRGCTCRPQRGLARCSCLSSRALRPRRRAIPGHGAVSCGWRSPQTRLASGWSGQERRARPPSLASARRARPQAPTRRWAARPGAVAMAALGTGAAAPGPVGAGVAHQRARARLQRLGAGRRTGRAQSLGAGAPTGGGSATRRAGVCTGARTWPSGATTPPARGRVAPAA
jgi:hypothetical protein